MEEITILKAEVYDFIIAKEARLAEVKQLESVIADRVNRIQTLTRELLEAPRVEQTSNGE